MLNWFCSEFAEIESIDKEGTWSGFDHRIKKAISEKVTVPTIANGGAGNIDHISQVISECQVSAVGLGSMVVFQNKDMGVLINFPDKNALESNLP